MSGGKNEYTLNNLYISRSTYLTTPFSQESSCNKNLLIVWLVNKIFAHRERSLQKCSTMRKRGNRRESSGRSGVKAYYFRQDDMRCQKFVSINSCSLDKTTYYQQLVNQKLRPRRTFSSYCNLKFVSEKHTSVGQPLTKPDFQASAQPTFPHCCYAS